MGACALPRLDLVSRCTHRVHAPRHVETDGFVPRQSALDRPRMNATNNRRIEGLSAVQDHRYRWRAQVLTRHVVNSSSRRLHAPPLGPGRHRVAGHPTVLPDLDGFSILDNAVATAKAITLPNRGPLRLVNGRPDPAILEAYNEYGFYILEGTSRLALPRIHLFVERIELMTDTPS